MSTFALGFTVEETGVLWCGHAREDSAETSLYHKLDHRYFNPNYTDWSLPKYGEHIHSRAQRELKDDIAELLMVVHKLQDGNQQMWILPFLVKSPVPLMHASLSLIR